MFTMILTNSKLQSETTSRIPLEAWLLADSNKDAWTVCSQRSQDKGGVGL
jgi:hypothetical protein